MRTKCSGKKSGSLMTLWNPNSSFLSYPGHSMIPHISSTKARDRLPVAVSFQSTCLRCSSKKKQQVGRNRRSGDFRVGKVGFQADRVVSTRGLVTKRVQAVEFEHRPGWFDAIQPSTNLGIIEESRSNHISTHCGFRILPLSDRLNGAPTAGSSLIDNRHEVSNTASACFNLPTSGSIKGVCNNA